MLYVYSSLGYEKVKVIGKVNNEMKILGRNINLVNSEVQGTKVSSQNKLLAGCRLNGD